MSHTHCADCGLPLRGFKHLLRPPLALVCRWCWFARRAEVAELSAAPPARDARQAGQPRDWMPRVEDRRGGQGVVAQRETVPFERQTERSG